eukprot:6197814-Pleurochrysis_carterae.AAC.1
MFCAGTTFAIFVCAVGLSSCAMLSAHTNQQLSSRICLIDPGPSYQASDVAILVRSALDDEQQYNLYRALCKASYGSYEWQRLACQSSYAADRPLPLCVWQHPYTGESNVPLRPHRCFRWACNLAERTAYRLPNNRQFPDAFHCIGVDLQTVQFDSLVTLLYGEAGELPAHVDDGLPGLGLSVSLGSACTFRYGDKHIVLKSGDALFGRFGLVDHQ